MTFSAALLFSMSVVAAQFGDEPLQEEGFFEETGDSIDEAAEETGEAIEEAAEETGEALDEGMDETRQEMEQMDAPEPDMEPAARIDVDEEPRVEQGDVDVSVDFGGTEEDRAETLLGIEPVGAMVMVGGGAIDFARSEPSSFTQTGGYWNARIAGTRTILSAEAAYIGRAQAIDAVGLSAGSTLLGNGVEGLVRLNAPFEAEGVLIEPFAVAGGSWEYFTILNEGENTSSVDDNDAVVFTPVGVGLAAAWQGLSVDVRGLYRHAFISDMFGQSGFGIESDAMSTWQLGANLGFEF